MQQLAPTIEKDEIEAMLRDRIGQIGAPRRTASEVGLLDSLDQDLGVDSLGFIELLMELENTFGFECDGDFLLMDAYPDVGAVVDYVTERMQTVQQKQTSSDPGADDPTRTGMEKQ